MATVNDLAEVIALVTGENVSRVRQYARALREAGDLPTATGGGTPAPHVSAQHAVLLLLAAMASPELVRDAPTVAREFFELRADDDEPEPLTLGLALEDEIESSLEGVKTGLLKVVMIEDPTAVTLYYSTDDGDIAARFNDSKVIGYASRIVQLRAAAIDLLAQKIRI